MAGVDLDPKAESGVRLVQFTSIAEVGLGAQREAQEKSPGSHLGIAGMGLEPKAESGVRLVHLTSIAGVGLEPTTPAL